jgi:hypothetical protein
MIRDPSRLRTATARQAASLGMTGENKGRLPPLVDWAFGSRVSHFGNGSKQAAAGEENLVEGRWLKVEGENG